MQIVIFEEKYGPEVFEATTEEQWERVCLKVCLDRIDAGWYRPPGTKPMRPTGLQEDSQDWLRAAWKDEVLLFKKEVQ